MMFMNIPQRRRGSVAIRQADTVTLEGDVEFRDKNWLGVFINDDSNPVKFGSQLWEELQDHWQCLGRFADNLLKCSYWDEYKRGGLCQFCGKFGVGQPNAVSGHIFKLVQENGPKSMAPDPNSTWHTHIKPMPAIEAKNSIDDGMWIEWAYVLDPKKYSLEILKAVRLKGFHETMRNGKKWQQENYQYVSAASVNLFCEEPNWEIIENRGLNMAEYYFDKATPKITIGDLSKMTVKFDDLDSEGENS